MRDGAPVRGFMAEIIRKGEDPNQAATVLALFLVAEVHSAVRAIAGPEWAEVVVENAIRNARAAFKEPFGGRIIGDPKIQ